MARYFLELAYKGTAYAGFQVQQNANTVQAEMEKALGIYYRQSFELTGSSRTDAGVHARQNYFHFDAEGLESRAFSKDVYHINAILPGDIVLKTIRPVAPEAHARFDASSRYYIYSLYQSKDPFLAEKAYFYPYQLDLDLLNQAAALLMEYRHFESFSKRNSQVFTYECTIMKSFWEMNGPLLQYHVEANRFLRGMVRGLVGTMLRVGRGKTSIEEFRRIIEGANPALVDFATPAHGLMLAAVKYEG